MLCLRSVSCSKQLPVLCSHLPALAAVPAGCLAALQDCRGDSGRRFASQFRRSGQLRDKQLRKIIAGLSNEEVSRVHRLLHEMRLPEETPAGTRAAPSPWQLRQVVVQETLPFIAFGFLDNAIMICAGEYIDLTVGATLGISTMAAAALGNWISDLSGIGLGNVVEGIFLRLGLPRPGLSQSQLDHRATRRAVFTGRMIGITIGCLVGMFPLYWFK